MGNKARGPSWPPEASVETVAPRNNITQGDVLDVLYALDDRVSNAESNITSDESRLTSLESSRTTDEANIATNTTNIAARLAYAAAPSGGDDTAALQTLANAGGVVFLKASATYKLTGSTGLVLDITWPASWAFAGFTWTNPANGKRRAIDLIYDSKAGKYVVTSISLADY